MARQILLEMNNMKKRNWKEFSDRTKDKSPRDLVQKAVKYIRDPNKGRALDVGGGGLRDTKFLLSLGFDVTVIDSSPYLQETINELEGRKPHFANVKFDEYEFKQNNYDLVNAMCALPFNGKETFKQVFRSIKKSLKVNGILSANLYGSHDVRNTQDTSIIFHTKEEVLNLLVGMDILFFEEKEYDTEVNGESKHWHIFYFIAKK